MAWYDPFVKAIGNIGQSAVDNAGSVALGGLGLLAAEKAYSRLGDVGEQAIGGVMIRDPETGEMVRVPGAYELAQMGLEQTAFKPFTLTSATGSQFGVTSTEDGGLAAGFGLSQDEAALQNMFMQQAMEAGQGPIYGQMMGRQAGRQAYGLGQQFMDQAGACTADREADVYSRIRAMQSPEEERQRLALEERLAGQGRLGVSTAMYGGTPEQLAMAKAQEEARNQAAVSAIQQAQAEQMQQGQLAQAFTGLGSQAAAQDLALRGGQQSLGLQALGGAYMPQAQLLNVQQAAQLYPQLQQRGQLYGAGLFGEATATGLQALLGSSLGQANLMGTIGSGLLSGAFRR